MYNLIDGVAYSKYNQILLKQLHKAFREKDDVFFAQVLYDEMLMVIDDYALFLSFYDKYRRSGNVHQAVHLGENCLYRATCFWEHMAYFLCSFFHEYMFTTAKGKNKYFKEDDRTISFKKVIKCLIDNAKDIDVSEYDRIKSIEELFSGRFSSRSIRHITTHRYHTGVLSVRIEGSYKTTSPATPEVLYGHVDKIREELESDFKAIFLAIEQYLKVVKWRISKIPVTGR
ncbi:MAG: hypothetical protein HPY50_07195 [Firmicutes bacterium]|nr:hypothetical protein [Bacillota bacterium]